MTNGNIFLCSTNSSHCEHFHFHSGPFVRNAKPPSAALGPVALVRVFPLTFPPSDPSLHPPSVQLACTQFERTFSSFAFCPLCLQLFPPLLSLLLGQLSLTETWFTIKRVSHSAKHKHRKLVLMWHRLFAAHSEQSKFLRDLLWFSSTDSQVSSAPQSPVASALQPSPAWHEENTTHTHINELLALSDNPDYFLNFIFMFSWHITSRANLVLFS